MQKHYSKFSWWVDWCKWIVHCKHILCTPEPVFLKSLDLGTECHTAQNTYAAFKEVIEDVGSTKVQAIVTDNATNMKALLRNDYPHLLPYVCVAHGLKLLAKDFLEIHNLSWTVAMVKDIFLFFNNNHVPHQVFNKIQTKRQLNATTLQIPVSNCK